MAEPEGHNRRRRARVRVEGEVAGRIHTAQSAPVIDLSESGALIEVPVTLRPGTVYVLRLPLGTEVALRCRVVRSYVHGVKRIASGETSITYRSALEFVDLGEKERVLIQQQMVRRSPALDAGLLPEGHS
jgi:hypothetical protein